MKKYFILAFSAILLAGVVSLSVFANEQKIFDDLFDTNVEVLTNGESTNVVCRCSKVTTQNCAVNNWGAVCASGNNTRCWDYNLNCN